MHVFPLIKQNTQAMLFTGQKQVKRLAGQVLSKDGSIQTW